MFDGTQSIRRKKAIASSKYFYYLRALCNNKISDKEIDRLQSKLSDAVYSYAALSGLNQERAEEELLGWAEERKERRENKKCRSIAGSTAVGEADEY